jgi:hypothetical protein
VVGGCVVRWRGQHARGGGRCDSLSEHGTCGAQRSGIMRSSWYATHRMLVGSLLEKVAMGGGGWGGTGGHKGAQDGAIG